MDTHVFSSHGLKHLLQLNSELLDVIDDDTWLRGDREKSLHTHFSLPFLCLLPAFYCNQSRLVLLTFLLLLWRKHSWWCEAGEAGVFSNYCSSGGSRSLWELSPPHSANYTALIHFETLQPGHGYYNEKRFIMLEIINLTTYTKLRTS